MKTYFFILLYVLILSNTYAQTTNAFPLSGNVGIGTTSPSKLLTLSTFGNGTSISPLLRLEQYNPGSSISGTGVAIDMALGDNYNLPALAGQIRLVRSNYSNTTMYFATALANTVVDRMIIDPNGNVGIGTITPDAKLAVAGNVHAREVKVSVNAGADFVFNDGYKPLTLNETEQFVKANKHLPGIASESEMLKEGINLSEMNIKLLQKIEELTLHLIEMEKKNAIQNEKHEKELELLKARLK